MVCVHRVKGCFDALDKKYVSSQYSFLSHDAITVTLVSLSTS